LEDTLELYAAVDLHGDNGYYAVCDENDRPLLSKRLPNNPKMILKELEPYKHRLHRGIAIESTYNWYWLADLLIGNGFEAELVCPQSLDVYRGLKNQNDQSDAFFLAHLQRLNLLPTAMIATPEQRAVRDLLRRRMLLVQQRTTHVLSFQSLIARQTGQSISSNDIKTHDDAALLGRLGKEASKEVLLMGQANLKIWDALTEQIKLLENAAKEKTVLQPEFEKLLTIPGIGLILALVITLETWDINRFKGPGHFCSYCRTVKAERTSNFKKKGKGNSKNGNKYLSWAFVEAAQFARRYSPEAKQWFDRKTAKTNKIIATKALASKLAKCAYYLMKNQEDYNPKKIFGS
jgi:transposase